MGQKLLISESDKEHIRKLYRLKESKELDVFPIDGGFNIGYDRDWSNFSNPRSTANSDFSKKATHAGAGGHLKGHFGIDIFGNRGTPIVAPVDGVVKLNFGNGADYGNAGNNVKAGLATYNEEIEPLAQLLYNSCSIGFHLTHRTAAPPRLDTCLTAGGIEGLQVITGNGNNIIENGENIEVSALIQNTGQGIADDAMAVFSITGTCFSAP